MRQSERLRGIEMPTRDAGLLLVVFAVPGLVITALTFHAVSLLAKNGLDATEAAVALTTLAAASAVGTIAGGLTADRASTRALLTMMTVMLTGGTLLLTSTSPAAAYVAFAILGASMGVFVIANSTVWARTYGLHRLGRIQGLGFAAMICGAAIGPLPLAVSLAMFGSYVPGIIGMAAISGLAVVAAVSRREPPTGITPAPAG
jgi:MFS family permease